MATTKRNYKTYCEDNKSNFPSKNKTLFKIERKTQKTQILQPNFNINSEIIVISDSDNDKNELPFLKTKFTKSKNSSPKIINISDSDDEDELPSLETVLKNITKYKKINRVELIEIQDDTTVANNNNDDFTYTINNHFLRISKKTIQSNLENIVKRLESQKVISYIAEICKHKERTNINKEEFMREVIIPELGVMFIMTDLKVHDYNTAIKIICKSVEYGNQNFFGDENDDYFW
ncbi:35721_t:CDS:2 [Gigaspora margarita]|uniref:35721_t:CDS:1 n=1 Tax=Gigaspora margarita TaxID=4874 RepID=A0ABM8VY04_GIGMA|nr:35721_t:CDS:2 [Gigaspora margarita]